MQINLEPILNIFNLPADQALYLFLINVGWIPIAIVFLWGAALMWKYYRNILFDSTLTQILLAIDIPRGNEQSVKAVENIFTYIAGAHRTFNLIEIWWKGQFQQGFSFEIVSIEGYTQFLIWTPTESRNLVETAIYSQYPDAEITEVNDYTEGLPDKFPDEEWDCWGCEFIHREPDAYPIKTYREFGDEMGRPETQFKDPMASLMDLYSSLGPGEQLWYQIIVYPTGFDWPKRMEKEVKKILREKTNNGGAGMGLLGALGDAVSGFVTLFGDILLGFLGPVEKTEDKKEDEPLKMLQLKPKEKKQVEAIQRKAGQLGFECKNRMVYIARKEVINKPKARNGFVGYMKQFMDLDLNNLKPDMDVTATSADYFFEQSRKDAKKTRIVSAYKGRSGTRGRLRKILSIEELATLWHFPIEAVVKAPLIQKAPGRKAVPPPGLPQREEKISDDLFASSEKMSDEAGGSDEEPIPEINGSQEMPWEKDEDDKSAAAGAAAVNLSGRKGAAPNNLPIA